MKVVPALLALLLLPVAGFAAVDDYKVIKLEQDVRRLEQQVRDLSRQIAELRRGTAPSIDHQAPAPMVREAETSPGPLRWLQAKNWESVRVGMSELQVIDTLGPPTSTRTAAEETEILFYAMEIAKGSFVGGSVELRDRRVVKINLPALK